MTIREVCKKFNITADTLRYYERVGVIPEVNRTPGGIRDYTEEDIKWVQNAVCFRDAGMPVELLIEYVKLYRMGDETFVARRDLLKEAREEIVESRKKYDIAIAKLDYKISAYEKAVQTGELVWDTKEYENIVKAVTEEFETDPVFINNTKDRRIDRMEYKKGYVYELMDRGGPTNCRESYFKEASEEMIRARTLCAKANATLPDDSSYVSYLEELFGRKLDDVRILTPFICDFGNRVTFGKNVFINHSAILSASGGIEFEDGVMLAPGVRIATINHDMNERHSIYTYGKVTIKKNAWIGMNVTICPGVTIGAYAVVAAGAVVTKDVPDYAVVGGVPATIIKYQNPEEQKE